MKNMKNSEDTWEFIHRIDTLAIQKQKEEIDKLKYDVELWKLRSDNWQKFCELTRPDLYNENARLKVEVERLRKAGDMCDQLLACFEMEGRKGVNIGRDMWRAAKEGKQS